MKNKNKKNSNFLLRVFVSIQFKYRQLARIKPKHLVSLIGMKVGLRLLVGFVVILLINVNAMSAEGRESKFYFNIASQPVRSALTEFVERTGHQLIFSYELVKPLRTSVLRGRYTVQDALDKMLIGTHLSSELTKRGVIVLTARDAHGDNNEGKEMNSKKRILASVMSGMLSGVVGADGDASADEMGWLLEEIVVTATKREQSLQDTAMSISALSSDTIDKRNLVGMGDYLNTLPGVTVLDQGPGFNTVVIRGLSANPQFEGADSSPVSGVYFGETAISGFGVLGNSADIKLVDMERIEVLRGPQGTLYGAGAMGGVVRNIPTAPNLDQIEGKLNLGYSSTGEEGGDNNVAKGVINIPLIEDTLAVRAVAYRFDDNGYYKNIAGSDPATVGAVANFTAVAVDRDDIGSSEVTGGRISALWRPIGQLTVNLSYLTQEIEQNGRGQADLDLPGGYSQSRFAIRTGTTAPFGDADQQESLSDDIEITNLTFDYDLGWASVFSSTSWVDEESGFNLDASGFVGDAFPLSQPVDYISSLFAEEVRLVSRLDGSWQFIVGAYYEERETGLVNATLFSGEDPNLSAGVFGLAAGDLLIFHNTEDRDLEQLAFFGELSYDFTDSLTLTLGARAFDYDRQVTTLDIPGALFSPAVEMPVIVDSSEKDTSFKAGLEYKPNDDTLLYATWSEGFRLGYPVPARSPITVSLCDVDNDGIYDGSNGISIGDRGIDSDYVENFELGGKFSLLDNRLTVNAALYQIDWDGIPISTTFSPSCTATANAGQARSRGVELDLAYHWSEKLLFNLSSSYVNAELTEDALAIGGSDGDRLPGSAEVNASVGVEYQFTLAGYEAYVRSDYAYVGGFYNNLQESGTEAGDYSKLNVKTGIAIDHFSIDLFVDNLTDEDAITWVDVLINDNRGHRLRPRTVGLNVGYQF